MEAQEEWQKHCVHYLPTLQSNWGGKTSMLIFELAWALCLEK